MEEAVVTLTETSMTDSPEVSWASWTDLSQVVNNSGEHREGNDGYRPEEPREHSVIVQLQDVRPVWQEFSQLDLKVTEAVWTELQGSFESLLAPNLSGGELL